APTSLAPREASFLAASATAIRRQRMLGAAVAAALVVGAVAVGLVIRARARREFESVVETQLQVASSATDSARKMARARDKAREAAFELFDKHDWENGEKAWTDVEDMAVKEEGEFRRASAFLEGALLLDPTRRDLRDRVADLTYERLLRAERDHHRDLAAELRGRLPAYGRREAVAADAHLELTIVPAGTHVTIERQDEPRRSLGDAPLSALTLRPGSVVVEFAANGRVAARLPLLFEAGQTRKLKVVLPLAASAPDGMIYVPPGPFLFGSADPPEVRRGVLRATPLHEVSIDGYYIARFEVTFAEWIEFLDDLAPDERRRRTPSGVSDHQLLLLTELGPRRWQLTIRPTTHTYTADLDQRIHYEHRKTRIDQDWTKFPVAGVSYEDAFVFAAWLDRKGRIPGARLCDEYEWERAARGADGRRFPSGDKLAPDDANIDVTYGRDPLAFGPDEVGSHPASRSPVGAEDMAGNVWEWVRSVEKLGDSIQHGGSWYQDELGARSMNRAFSEPTQHHPFVGVRLCATPRDRQGDRANTNSDH
ncbi:MAG TPA: SUMF1/EgtB/PvdO family nonheme iron enzyme, partial [Kofleriaceae bacterium]